MNTVQLHLILNHVPVITTFLSFLVLSWGFFSFNKEITKVGLVGFVLSGIMIIPVFFTGKGAEEIIKTLPDISVVFLTEHEQAAELSFWLTMLLGLLSAGGLILEYFKLKISNIYMPFLLLYSFITIASMSYTAYLGGNIRHTELLDTTIYEPKDSPADATRLNVSYPDTNESYKY